MPDSEKYPVGHFELEVNPTPEMRASWIDQLAWAPGRLKALVSDLRDRELSLRYRPGGWTIRQVVHHLADSHLNGTVRIRLALTEENPQIKTYDQELWARLSDANRAPIEPSLQILDGLHARLVVLLKGLAVTDLNSMMQHPEWGEVSVDATVQLYAWHSLHHLAHIENALASAQ